MRTKGYQLLISVAINEKPETVAIYNEFMSGVDRQDCSHFIRAKKKLFTHLSTSVYKLSQNVQQVCVAVINELLQMSCSNRPKQSKDEQRRVSKITVTNSKGNVMRKMCRICSKAQKKRRDSMWHCETCINKPGLCFEYFDEFRLSI